MQKVITITTLTNIIEKGSKFSENEYPVLSAYLSDGYRVVQMVPFATNATDSYRYSLTFVIEKEDTTHRDGK